MLIEQDKSNKHCTFLHAAMTVNSTKVLKIFLHDVCKVQCLLLHFNGLLLISGYGSSTSPKHPILVDMGIPFSHQQLINKINKI